MNERVGGKLYHRCNDCNAIFDTAIEYIYHKCPNYCPDKTQSVSADCIDKAVDEAWERNR